MTAKKKSAGSLAFLNTVSLPARKITRLPIDLIDPDPDQPRTGFHASDGMVDDQTQAALVELADDIRDNDLLQPITVRKNGDRYTIVMGERRWRAVRYNRDRGAPNSDEIDAIVRDDMEQKKLRMSQLSENLQRDDLSDLETATYLKKLLEEFPELQKQELARIIKKSNGYISRILALLDPKWSNVVDAGIITYASLLEQFKALPEGQRDKLVKLAQAEKRPLTSGDIKNARTSGKHPPAAAEVSAPAREASGQGGLTPEFLAAVEQLSAEQTPEGETYAYKGPSSPVVAPEARSAPGKQIIDTGGDAVIPPGAAALNPALLEKRELKLTWGQLAKLMSKARVNNASHMFTAMLPVGEMRAMLNDLGGEAPADDGLLPMALAQRLNEL